DPLALAGPVIADDVGVVELLEDLDLALETGLGRLAGQAGGHGLDGHDGAVERVAGLGVDGPVDGAHGAAAELPGDLEGAELFADEHGVAPAQPQTAVTSASGRRRGRSR